MKIKYLGTAAAEGIPALFCKCRVCENARKQRGKEIKTRSQALVDGKLLIDFPPDTYMHALYYDFALEDIRTCIVTHSHLDHLYERDLWCRNPGIANNIEETPLDMYLTQNGFNMTTDYVKNQRIPDTRVRAHLIEPFKPFEAEGYTVTPLKADHDPKANPVFFIIEKDGKAILYANDTGTYPTETVEYLKTCGKHFDLVSFDCTNVFLNYRGNHMGIVENAEVKQMLIELGLCDENTIFVINHFSHNGGGTHEEIVEEAKKYGFVVSYDSLEIEF